MATLKLEDLLNQRIFMASCYNHDDSLDFNSIILFVNEDLENGNTLELRLNEKDKIVSYNVAKARLGFFRFKTKGFENIQVTYKGNNITNEEAFYLLNNKARKTISHQHFSRLWRHRLELAKTYSRYK